MLNRRSFLKVAGSATAGTALGAKVYALTAGGPHSPSLIAANDHIQIALLGAGGQGQFDTRTAVQVPGVKLVAVADCYDGRLARSKEVWATTFSPPATTATSWRAKMSTPSSSARPIIGTNRSPSTL